MNVVYALSAYPVGILSDRLGRRPMLVAGFVALIVADLILAFAPGLVGVTIGVAFWGLHMGMTQGSLAAYVTDTTPNTLRGSAFGIFNFTSGIALLLAGLIAGLLWDLIGPQMTFLAGAAFTVAGLMGMAVLARVQRWTTG